MHVYVCVCVFVRHQFVPSLVCLDSKALPSDATYTFIFVRITDFAQKKTDANWFLPQEFEIWCCKCQSAHAFPESYLSS